jgi:hypothetical protein
MIFNPAHPGEVLRDYLGEMSVGDAASRLGRNVLAFVRGAENVSGLLAQDAGELRLVASPQDFENQSPAIPPHAEKPGSQPVAAGAPF